MQFSSSHLTLSTSPHFFKPHLPSPRLSILTLSAKPPFPTPKSPISISFSSSPPTNLGGWDDLQSPLDPNPSIDLQPLHNLFISIGFDRKKHLFLFLTGFVSAIAISRVRFSSIALLPASAVVFASGFFVGIVRGGGLLASIRNPGSANPPEKFRKLEAFLSDFDAKMSELKLRLDGDFNSGAIGIGEVGSCRDLVDSVRVRIGPARHALEALFHDDNRRLDLDEVAGDREVVEKSPKQRSSRRRKEANLLGFDFIQFLTGGSFAENLIGLRTRRTNALSVREFKEQLTSILEGHQDVDSGTNQMVSNPVPNEVLGNVTNDSSSKTVLENHNAIETSKQDTTTSYENVKDLSSPNVEPLGANGSITPIIKAGESELLPEEVSGNSTKKVSCEQMLSGNRASMINKRRFSYGRTQSYTDDMPLSPNYLSSHKNGLQFSNDCEKIGSQDQGEMQTSRQRVSVNGKVVGENGACSRGLNEVSVQKGDGEVETVLNNHRCSSDKEEGEATPSSTVVDGEEFNKHMEEAGGLLKQARECLLVEMDDGTADTLLRKCASILSRALRIRPASLKAIGQLGNAFLLHGELKLKRSRELRAILSSSDNSSSKQRSRVRPVRSKYQALSKEKATSALVDTCEECEELLVEAGRKYRMALTVDGNDVRALYNWGLALTFRAELIADVGPEAALDADKVYLAAIDKFDAMVSRSNAYAPDALFRWGAALQLRSKLRPNNSSEKLKLLHQAKRLLEDALHMDSANPQVREALSSCISELGRCHR